MSTELDTAVNGEIVDESAPLSPADAKKLDAEIKAECALVVVHRNKVLDLLKQSYHGNIAAALGYPSWTKWFAENVKITPIDKADRQWWVAAMSARGMSERAVALSLGVSQKTVDRDRAATESNDSVEPVPEPAMVTSLDGKRRPKHPKPKTKPKPDDSPDAVRRQIVDGFARAANDLVDMLGEMAEHYDERIGDAICRLVIHGAANLTEAQRNRIATAIMTVDTDA